MKNWLIYGCDIFNYFLVALDKIRTVLLHCFTTPSTRMAWCEEHDILKCVWNLAILVLSCGVSVNCTRYPYTGGVI